MHNLCFRHIAKAYAKMGKAYRIMGDLKNAQLAYKNALAEHSKTDYELYLSEIEAEIKKNTEDLSEINAVENQNGKKFIIFFFF